MPPSLDTELQQLKKEVATLREQLNDLRQFLHISKPKKGEPGHPTLSITCSVVRLLDPDDPQRTQGLLAAGETGPCLGLWGDDEKGRILLEVTKDGPYCHLYGKDLKPGVTLSVMEQAGRGCIAAHEAGKPRALLKASDANTGVVSVLHDDNTTRAAMISSETEGGEIFAVTPDMQVGVKITAGIPGGSAVIVNRPNGKPAVIVGSIEKLGGTVIVKDAKGKIKATLPSTKRKSEDEDDDD